MLNKEKYAKELEDILKQFIAVKKNGEIAVCPYINCCECIFQKKYCWDKRKEWLNSEYKGPVLTDKEKEYLRAVIIPFRDRVEYIKKCKVSEETEQIFIFIKEYTEKDEIFCGYGLPPFEIGTMYKGMPAEREFTLEELGL